MVSDYCIKKALASINAEEYVKTLTRLAEQKLKILRNEKNQFIKHKKLQDYLLQKGFETDLIKEVVNKKNIESTKGNVSKGLGINKIF